MSKQVLIIGGGLGGLFCGKLLTRERWSVTILEQGMQAGGALQTFVREGIRFDTGFHSVGGMGPGEPLRKIFESFGLNYLPWVKCGEDECIDGGPFMRLSSGTVDEFNHVAKPYVNSTWRLKGGGKTLVDALTKTQDIRLGKKVVSIEDREVLCSDSSTFRADYIISAIHPRVTFGMLKDHVRSSYLKRLSKLEDGPGVVTLNCKLREGMLPWQDHEIFIGDKVMIHYGEADADGFARSLDLLGFAPITPEEIKETAGTRLPDLTYAIDKYWVSTPETWERYTGTPGGTAFGLKKYTQADYLPPETPLPWLYLTGQNIGLHGVLGTCVSAINTCKALNSKE